MTWIDRMKLVWTTFKREALIFYIMYIILIVAFTIIFSAIGVGAMIWIMSAFPNALNGSISEAMPIPGMPSSSMTDSFSATFGNFSGSMGDLSALTPLIGPFIGIFILVLVISIIVGSGFQAGIVNLTFKAYREKPSFKDFKFTGFLRILSWVAFLILINIIIFIIGIIGTIAFSQHSVALIIFLILYGLFIIGLIIYAAPWLTSSVIYLLAHPEKRFSDAIKGSFSFFKSHMGSLWGLIGTSLLFQVPYLVLSAVSYDRLATIYSLVVSPFISILAIVWFLSLDDEERNYNAAPTIPPTENSSVVYPEKQAITITKLVLDPQTLDTRPTAEPNTDSPVTAYEAPNIALQKMEPSIIIPRDDPNFCPSCGKANTGTAYCPQCGTKL